MEGIINLNKPEGMSSARAVAAVKRLLPRGTKVGHAGTLDPFATGVLLVLVGKATRLCEQLMDQPKQYEATIKLGATTETDDTESPEISNPDAREPARQEIVESLGRFVGTIMQRPPAYSALKIGGRRAYDLARKGRNVVLEPRPIQVYSIDLLEYAWPFVRVRIDCGRGTYIRSIARDLGESLGTSGYLAALVRTRVGPFALEKSVQLERFQSGALGEFLHDIIPPERSHEKQIPGHGSFS